jgi:hypothetical protein
MVRVLVDKYRYGDYDCEMISVVRVTSVVIITRVISIVRS